MAIRGENIGTAYVKILADGKGLGKSVRDEMDDIDWDDMGRKGSQQWQEGFKKEQSNAANRRELLDAIAAPLVRGDWLSREFFRGEAWRTFSSSIEKEFGDAGTRARVELEDNLLSGELRVDNLERALDQLLPRIVRKQKEIAKEAAEAEYDLRLQYDREFEADVLRLHEAAMKDRLDMDRQFDLQHQRLAQQAFDAEVERLDMLRDAYRMNAEFDRRQRRLAAEQDAEFNRHLRDRALAVDNLRDAYGDLLINVERLSSGERGLHRRDLINRVTTLRAEMEQAGGATNEWRLNLRRLEKQLVDIHPRTDRATRGINNFADSVGRMTGRGSRNDFINFFGSVNRNFVNLLSVVPRLAGGFMRLAGTFSEARNAAIAGGRGGLTAALSGLLAAGKSAGAGIAALAAGAVVLTTLMGPAVALLSSLLAIVTSLVSTIGFALVGGLSAAAGLLVTFGGAAGVAALAFSGLDKQQKKVLENNFKPVIDQFKELQDIAASRMFRNLGGLGDNIAAGLERLEPVIAKTADAIRDVGISFGQSLQSRGYRQFVNALERFLPDATRQLGDIIGNTIGGFGGIFRGMIPFLERTLNWLDDITTRFTEWANSVRGQRQIKQFFEDAADSAKSLGGFLGDVWDLLTDILSAGRGTGDSLFDSMADNIRKFTEYLRENPDALKDWFSDAKDIARDMGDLAVAIGELMDHLDSPGARKGVRVLLNIGEFAADVAKHIPALTQLSGVLETIFDIFDDKQSGPDKARSAFAGLRRVIVNSNPAFAGLADAIDRVWEKLRKSDVVQRVVSEFRRLPGRIRGAIDNIPGIARAIFNRIPRPVRGVVDDIIGFFRRLPGRVRSAISNVPGIARAVFNRLPAPVRGVVNDVVGFFRALPGRMRSAISSIPSRFRGTIDGLPGIARGIIDRIVGFFRDAPGRIRSGISSIPSVVRGVVDGLPGIVNNIIDRIVGFFGNLPGQIRNRIFSIPGDIGGVFQDAVDRVRSIPDAIVGLFSGLGGRIAGAIGSINIPMSAVNLPDIPRVPWPFATGGLVYQRTYSMLGEDGPEAVVPLDRPLSEVDPSVRWLSAIAQGQSPAPGGGKSIDVGGLTVVSPNADPRAVARETVNALLATGF